MFKLCDAVRLQIRSGIGKQLTLLEEGIFLDRVELDAFRVFGELIFPFLDFELIRGLGPILKETLLFILIVEMDCTVSVTRVGALPGRDELELEVFVHNNLVQIDDRTLPVDHNRLAEASGFADSDAT